jgi:hypothetical protein
MGIMGSPTPSEVPWPIDGSARRSEMLPLPPTYSRFSIFTGRYLSVRNVAIFISRGLEKQA